MPTTKAQQKAVARYKAKAYDETKILLQKGEKDRLKAHAAKHGESLNGFINRAVRETMQRDNEQDEQDKK